MRTSQGSIKPGRWWRGLFLSGACLCTLPGCVNLWDDITNRNYALTDHFKKEDPLVVLRDSSDGYKRSRALTQLREPTQHGGTNEEQELYIKILTKSAAEDGIPLCRLGAIRALATYKDPRAAKCLEDVYQQRLPFTPEFNTAIRQLALASIVQTGNPDSRSLLVRVARSPSGPIDSSLTDRQQTQDERLTAIRGLAKYSQYDSIDTLVYILEQEKDVALRARAHESLKTATGKNLPAEAKAWRDLMQNPQLANQDPPLIERVMFWKK